MRDWTALERHLAGARVMASHRAYTRANGDALSSALTYAVLVGAAPVLLVAATVASWVGGASAGAVARAADVALPQPLVDAVAAADGPPRALGVLAAVMVPWTSVRLVRAARTGVRAVCGQDAGSGNPVRDAGRDVVLALALLAGVTVVVGVLAAPGPAGVRRAAAAGATGLLLAASMRLLSWNAPGRPSWPAALRAATAGTAALVLLCLLGGWYVSVTASGRETVYGTAAALVSAAVLVAMACRVVLRTVSWATTAQRAAESSPSTAPGQQVERQPLWVVVPALDEEASIGATLGALAAQTDTDLSVVVVDNGSRDGTVAAVRSFARAAPFPVEVVHEPVPGAGTAVDTGMRHAISRGAGYLLRTDADCRPRPQWVASARARLDGGAEMVCGRSVPRPDENPTVAERYVLPAVQRLLAVYGRYRRSHRDPRFKAPYVLCHGHSIAITADLYERCGGAVRQGLEVGSEDVALLNRAREHSSRVVRAEEMVVENSLRRLRRWGTRRTLLWYWDRRYRPATTAEVHVR